MAQAKTTAAGMAGGSGPAGPGAAIAAPGAGRVPEDAHSWRLTRAFVHLDRLTHNVRLLQEVAGERPLWPVIKADAYGHGARIVAAHLARLGYRTFGVADVHEAVELTAAGIGGTFVTLSPTLPEHSEALVACGCEPVVCSLEMVEALAAEAAKARRPVALHLEVDTGMGRAGVRPAEVVAFLESCRRFPAVRVRGLMSHFPRADEADKSFSREQIECFRQAAVAARAYGVEFCHLANSAGIFDFPEALFDAVRPGISLYGLASSAEVANPRVRELRPVLEWKTRVTVLKEFPAGVGLSYGHAYRTPRPSLIATVPLGYADGFSRRLSGRVELLVGGVRCAQVGRVTMDMTLIDVTALRGRVSVGDEAVVLGRQGDEEIAASELAEKLGTISYEVLCGIAHRVPRIAIGGEQQP